MLSKKQNKRKNQSLIPFEKSDLRLTEPAVLNWARWSGIENQTSFNQARGDLLDLLNLVSIIYPAECYPDWMSQKKPGVDFWLFIPNSSIVLSLISSNKKEYKYIATSTLAPRSIRKTAVKDFCLTHPVWTSGEIKTLENSQDLAGEIRVSNHACERMFQREDIYAKHH